MEQDIIADIFPDDPNWKHLRTIASVPGPNFLDETDWAGGGTLPPVSERISVPSLNDSQATDLGTLVLYGVITTASAGAIVPRGTCSFSLQLIESVGGRENVRRVNPSFDVLPDHAIDSASVTSIPPQRKIYVTVRGSNWVAVRFFDFANVPPTAVDFHILYRLE